MRIVTFLFSLIVTLGVASLACGEAGPPEGARTTASEPEAGGPEEPLVVAQAGTVAQPVAHHEGGGHQFPCIEGDPSAGEAQYKMFCESCHGPGGNGEGPAAAALVPKPARHNDGNYMNPLSNEHLFTIVNQGGAGLADGEGCGAKDGGCSPLMAPWGSVLGNDQAIWNVVAYVRTLADPPYSCPE